jgi:nucleoside-diphosphate-sugar epimerase
MRLLVTGASGFVGQAFCKRALECSYKVRGTLLSIEFPSVLLEGVEPVDIESIGPDTQWTDALKNVDTVIHLAARVHIMNDVAQDSLLEYRRVNTKGTAQLASQSAAAGVRRFIFISSIKVNGEQRDFPYNEQDKPTPEDPYGISKWEAEQRLGGACFF